jgi:hypothetical protein
MLKAVVTMFNREFVVTLFPSAPDYRIAVYRAFSLSRDPARAHHILDFSSPAKQFKSEITKKTKKKLLNFTRR